MITSEVERLIRSLVEATEESMIDPGDVKNAICEAFDKKQPKVEVEKECKVVIGELNKLSDDEILERIRDFVERQLPLKVENAKDLILSRKEYREFSIIAVFSYYQLAQKGGCVDRIDWRNLIARKCGYSRGDVSNLIRTKLKPCLAAYLNVENYYKRAVYIMDEFYRRYMLEW